MPSSVATRLTERGADGAGDAADGADVAGFGLAQPANAILAPYPEN